MIVKTLKGYQYAVTAATDTTIADDNGLNLQVSAGQQSVFTATSDSVDVSGDAKITQSRSAVIVGGGDGGGVDPAPYEREIERLRGELAELQAQKDELQAQYDAALITIEDYQQQVEALNNQIAILEAELAEAESRPVPYKSITDLGEYTYQVDYDDIIDLDQANSILADYGDNMGGCSAIYAPGVMGHNYDWHYDESAVMVVKTPERDGLHAVIGVAGSVNGITDEVMQQRINHKALVITPWLLVDGCNDAGLSVAVNVVPKRDDVSERGEGMAINSLAVARYILDNFATAFDAATWFTSVKLVTSEKLLEAGYELQWLVTDKTSSYSLTNSEFGVPDYVEGAVKQTNFRVLGLMGTDITSANATVYTPGTQDATHDAIRTNGIEEFGQGLERFNLLSDFTDFESVKIALD